VFIVLDFTPVYFGYFDWLGSFLSVLKIRGSLPRFLKMEGRYAEHLADVSFNSYYRNAM